MQNIDEKINELICRRVICEVNEIKIIPRKDDLPNHYIKGNDAKEIEARKRVIIGIEDNLKHKHDACVNKIIVSKNDHKIVIDVNCKQSRYILKRVGDTSKYFLITGFKLRDRQISKSISREGTLTLDNINNLKNVINSL